MEALAAAASLGPCVRSVSASASTGSSGGSIGRTTGWTPISSASRRTAASGKRRWPPSVRWVSMRPSSDHRRSRLGLMRSASAAACSVRNVSSSGATGGSGGWRSSAATAASRQSMNASRTVGSNWPPRSVRSAATACSTVPAGRYTRSVVRASNASATAAIRPASGISSACSLRG
ncbi:hypothetical protein DVA67_005395 [Solirubrobacter sp. CPCC 204708]|nr:hypothetical protein [Solirubrobacter deserti]